MTDNFKFWDKTKRGTIIVTSARCGGHFLQHLINDLYQGERSCCGEIHKNIFRDIDSFPSKEGLRTYQMHIANNFLSKRLLLSNLEKLDEWHLINLTRNDLTSWFLSWWFMHEMCSFANPNGDAVIFDHHNTPGANYETYVQSAKSSKLVLSESRFLELRKALTNYLINFQIPCNESVDYSVLSALQTERTIWAPNKYPDVDLEEIFVQGKLIKDILLSVSALGSGNF
jgi:hypothetical protein